MTQRKFNLELSGILKNGQILPSREQKRVLWTREIACCRGTDMNTLMAGLGNNETVGVITA